MAASLDVYVTLVADKGYDACDFIDAIQRTKVTPHIAQNKSGRLSAVADKIAQGEGSRDLAAQAKLIEQDFGWAKFVAFIRNVTVRGLKNVDHLFVLRMAAYNLVRVRTLADVLPLGAQRVSTRSDEPRNGKNCDGSSDPATS